MTPRISERAIETAQDVLAKCAANDPWFPQPSESTVLAWAEHFTLCNIDKSDLLAGVTIVYRDKGGGFKPLPADVITAARAIRADRSGRLEPAQLGGDKSAPDDEPNPPGWDDWTSDQRVAHYWRTLNEARNATQ